MAELANTLAFAAYDQQSSLYVQSFAASPVQNDAEKRETKYEATPRDRDSGVFLSDSEDIAPPPSRTPSISLKQAPSTTATTTPQRTDSISRRLRRPAELNLSGGTQDSPKPKSELELRYDMIRNSQNRSKAALKSPTQLLNDRLNLSPKKDKHEEKVRIFNPPRPMLNGCILPGPAAQMEAFTGASVRARTEKGGRPAWWCKFDKVVVFDGIEESDGVEMKFKTRTSKGLTVARRRGDTETVVIPMNCAHCREMLNREEWKYDVQVCKRGVCWDCKERCRWEMEQGKVEESIDGKTDEARNEANRERADSVLQDGQAHEEELMEKIGIEQSPRTPIEAVGGIEERLEFAESLVVV
ncbi:hypothetical protein BU26DRAFT_522575 [Trematosphaeria pertusa]|uniref:Uncharacterized protein n=1 Tax=Trematosphaeria pertusa TaxID=390896 RepID=A0A6A6I4A3_9PLEO|nr:uncharacterized protein BU26DRAFT_522575 [Trematosphaeria pertusa]KAF2244838.1 hypothetical protein BU26DRAFT_522575 [Trematosphaeria pertusa]